MTDPTSRGNPRPIDRGRAQLVERLFFEAADLRGQARRRFLDEHCAGDPTLRREVEVLLQIDEGGTAGVLGATPVDPGDLPRAVSASVHAAPMARSSSSVNRPTNFQLVSLSWFSPTWID